MARMPGAQWRPLPSPSTTRMARYDLVVIHTCVGSFEGTDGYFRRLTNGTNSHFLTGGLGELRQLVDTAVRSGATGAGNHRSISVENADMGPGFAAWNTGDGNAVPAFTAAQVEALARLCAWANTTHGVPLVAADTSRPNARGIGFHRLGVNPYRVADGELWSSSYGKTCPAPRRIAQIPQIIARARQLVGGAPAPAPAPAPIPEDDMPYSPEQIANFASDGVANRVILGSKDKPVHTWEILRDLYNHQRTESVAMAGLQAAVKELSQVIAKQAGGEKIDQNALVERIGARVDAAVSDAAKLVKVEVSVNDQPAA